MTSCTFPWQQIIPRTGLGSSRSDPCVCISHKHTHTPTPPRLWHLRGTHRSASRKVFRVCSVATWLGEMLAIMQVLALPMKESFSTCSKQKAGQWNQPTKGILTTYCVQDTGPHSYLPPSTERQFTKEETQMINKQTKQVLTAPLIKEMQTKHFTILQFVGTSQVGGSTGSHMLQLRVCKLQLRVRHLN